MKIKTLLLMTCLLFASACGSKSYMNYDYNKNNQNSFNLDANYCQSMALSYAPSPTPYAGRGPQTTYGRATIYDQYGNRYSGNYSETTQPNYMEEASKHFASAAAGFEAQAQQQAIWNHCMSERGWYEVTGNQ